MVKKNVKCTIILNNHKNVSKQHYYLSLSGIGTGAGSSIFGLLTRSTASEDRATVFAAVMACRQAGLLIGQCLF